MDLQELKRGLAAEKRAQVKIERQGNDPVRGIAKAIEEGFRVKTKLSEDERKEKKAQYMKAYNARRKAERKGITAGRG